jgi:hypothetical protein
MSRVVLGVFTPGVLGAMFIPGGQLILYTFLSIAFLSTAAAVGGMSYLRSREEEKIRAHYEALHTSTEQKKALDRQICQ